MNLLYLRPAAPAFDITMKRLFLKRAFFTFDLARLAAGLLIIAMGCLMAWWGFTLATPSRPIASPSASPLPAAVSPLIDVAAHFESAQAQNQQAMAALDVRLLGTVAVGSRGRAVVLSEGKPVTLGVGDELSPGVVLAQVGPKFAEFSAGGVTQRVELAEPTPSDQSTKGQRGAMR